MSGSTFDLRSTSPERSEPGNWPLRVSISCSHILRRLPGGSRFVDWARTCRYQRLASKRPSRMGRYEIDQWAWLETDGIVQAGPFAGMKYLKRAVGSVLAAKLLGTYECELHSWLEKALRQPYQQTWVIGSGEGFYSVGAAMRMPTATVFAFDIDREARLSTFDMALQNDVADRVVIGSQFRWERMKLTGSGRAFVICDIEGGESQLFANLPTNLATRCDFLIEVHDEPSGTSIRDELVQRFEQTHSVEQVEYQAENRSPSQWPLRMRSEHARHLAVDEGRVRGTRWLLFTSRQA